MALLLVVLFIVVPIAELYVIIQLGSVIGVLPTIALLILDSVIGAALMRSQGRATWRRFNRTLAEGRMPGREVMDGALVIFGGALLLTPGFLTDFLGLVLLLPPTRAFVRALLVRRFAGRLVASASSGAQTRVGRLFTFEARPRASDARGPGSGSDPGRRRDPASGDGDGDVVEGTASEVPPHRRELP